MKTLNRFIVERLKINKDTKPIQYNYHPKDFNELRSLLEQLLKERGKDADLNDIDVSKVTTFYDNNNKIGLFENLDPHNIDISRWDVSNVENMSYMFQHCNHFNCDLSRWDVSTVFDMVSMFFGCKNFNCDLSKWNVSNVEYMESMFVNCKTFRGQGLENWNISNVIKDMGSMFSGCENFNCDLSKWDVSNVKYMGSMFCHCENFTGQGLEKWDVSNVENMNAMFYNCKNFDCDLSKWDVSNVKDIKFTFCGCEKFTGQGLDKWKPINVWNMYAMFDDCTSLKNKPSWYKE